MSPDVIHFVENDTAAGYAFGRAESDPVYHILEIVQAMQSWKDAESDHGHTSYYGVAYIRKMRAYWLGRARAYRHCHRIGG